MNVLRMFEKRRDDKMGAGVGECTYTVNAHTRTKGAYYAETGES